MRQWKTKREMVMLKRAEGKDLGGGGCWRDGKDQYGIGPCCWYTEWNCGHGGTVRLSVMSKNKVPRKIPRKVCGRHVCLCYVFWEWG